MDNDGLNAAFVRMDHNFILNEHILSLVVYVEQRTVTYQLTGVWG